MPSDPRTHDPLIRSRWTLWAFPLAIALIALFALGGDWGKYLDDWSCAARDPVKGTPDWTQTPWREYAYFWRPLLMLHWYYLHTALWNHMWALHLLSACVHAGVAGLLYALLRRMRLTRTASTAGALAFLLMPLPSDVVFWATAVSISQSLALVLVIALTYVGYVEGRGWTWRLPLMAALGFAAPCLYEQPVMIILALPVIALAAGAVTDGGCLRRSVVGGVVAGAPMLVYVALLVMTAPKTARGGAGSFVRAEELPNRLRAVATIVADLHSTHLRHMTLGGFVRGVEWLTNGWSLALVAGAACLGGLWAYTSVLEPRPLVPAQTKGWAWAESALVRGATTWLAGLLIWALAFVPIMPFRGQTVELRSTYVSNVGLAILSAALVNLIWRSSSVGSGTGRVVRGLTSGGIAVAAMLGTVVMLGHQSNYQSRSRLDEQQAAQLRALADAGPPLPPGTVVVVLENAQGSSSTGFSLFDHGLAPWSMASWSARGMVQETLRRADVEVTSHNPWIAPSRVIRDLDERGFRSIIGLPSAGTPDPAGGTRVEWTHALPIAVGPDGVVRAVDRLIIERTDGRDFDITPPLAGVRQAANPPLPTIAYVIESRGLGPNSKLLQDWQWGSTRVEPADSWAHLPYGWKRPAFCFGPYGHAPLPGVITTTLPEGPERLIMTRATLDPTDVASCKDCESVRVWVVVRSGDAEVARGEVVLDPAQAARLERWWPVRLRVPAMTSPGRVEIHVDRATSDVGPTPKVLVMPCRVGPVLEAGAVPDASESPEAGL